MNPGANSLGAMLRWKSGGKIKSTESRDITVVVTALLTKLFLSLTKLLNAVKSLWLVFYLARIYFFEVFCNLEPPHPEQNNFHSEKLSLNGFPFPSVLPYEFIFSLFQLLVLLQMCRFFRSGIFVFGQVDDFSGLPKPLQLVIDSKSWNTFFLLLFFSLP